MIAAPASPGDSVFIFPGTYTDTPDVTIPDLLIKGVAGPEMTIFDGLASSDAALTVSVGGVVLDGFTFTHSTGGDGGGVDAAGSPNTRCEFEERGLPTDPIIPIAGCNRALDGDFTMKNCIASGNKSTSTCDGTTPRCYGVKVIATGLVTLTNVEASNNGSDVDCTGNGYQLTKSRGPDGESCFGIMAFSVGSNVMMTDIEANDNRAKGTCYRHETCFGVMADETAGNVTMERVTTNGNGADGDCKGDDVCFGTAADGVEGKVTVIDLVAKNNGAKRSCVDDSGTGLNLNDSCAGGIFDGEDWSLGLWIHGADASDNGAFGGDCGSGNSNDSCTGLIIDGKGGDIELGHLKANNNGATGNCQGNDMCSGITHDPPDVVGRFSLTYVQANGNGAGQDCLGRDSCFGILHDTGFCSGNVEFEDVEASDNGAGRDCPANDSCQGIVIDSGDNTGYFTFTGVKANANGAGRDCGNNDNCLGILIDGGGVTHDPLDPEDLAGFCSVITPTIRSFFVSLTGIEANSNGAGRNCDSNRDQCSGVIVDGVLGPIRMRVVTANDNRAAGACLGPDSCSGVTADTDVGTVTLCQVDAERNGAPGTCSSGSSCYGLTAEGPDNVTLGSIRTIANSGNGTVVDAGGTIFINSLTSTGNGGTNLVTNTAPVSGGKDGCITAPAPAMSRTALLIMVVLLTAAGVYGIRRDTRRRLAAR